ncbi:33 kDa ribonucleoprotein, chloroplastic [Juglans microcarpa x Juglans regia]|uniref:33 kDa ribonucleoprotein, chloroplastic n=1 Tax=Juglans microcarpa x Juglans regia TaxID=2249226 RepID=UPI001B7EA9E5|nr:33 kDa ribonucleoprotein, chloroplastic [Juglans microcarpa x Juglans regia]
MSASSISMAATTIASSSICRNKPSNLSFPTSFTPIPTHVPSKPRPTKPLNLKSHLHNFSPFGLISVSRFPLASTAFDSFETEKDSQSTEQEDPEAESSENQAAEEEEEGEPNVLGSSEEGRLYVGNLPYSMTSAQLTEVFEEAGRVVSVEVVYDRITDRSRGFAFVSMGSVEEAKEAIRMFDGSQVGGRTVKVNFPEVPRGGEREVMGPKVRNSSRDFTESPHKIYAGNLGWGVTSQGLRDAFADQRGILSAKVIYERNSGRSRGFGFVSFETAKDAESALNAMNGVEVEGRPLRLNSAAERSSSASPPAENRDADDILNGNELLSSISS